MNKNCGIYIIINKINQHSYVGLSKDIKTRWQHHINESKNPNSKEYQKTLYRAFRKYGIENFDFQILELCPEEKLAEREIYWINKLDTVKNGYNELNSWQPEFKTIGEKHPNHKLTEKDVIDIRVRYANHERCKEVEKFYSDKISHSGFSKIWKGETWKNIMPEVYTEENKKFHLHNTGNAGASNGKAKITEKDVINIRQRKAKGEARSSVYKDYKQILSQNGFDSIWYYVTWKNITIN